MAKVIKGTAGLRKTGHTIRRGQQDVRQTRCLKCRMGLAVQVPDGKGGTIYKCPQCEAKFTFTKM